MGVIAKYAVDEFMTKKRRDSNKAKRFSDRALDRMLRKYNLGGFAGKLRKCQKVAILLGIHHPGYMNILEMGLGKTLCYLLLFDYWKRQQKIVRGVVLVPNTGNVAGWVAEAKKHTPWLKVVGLDQKSAVARREAFESKSDLVVCTYMGWCSLIKEVVYNPRRKKNEWTIGKHADKMEHQFQSVCFDEITYIQNHDSLFGRAGHRLARRCFQRSGMTGTPFGKNPAAMWSQFYATDLGDTLGPTLGLFRAGFFKEGKHPWTGYPEYKFDKRKSGLLNRFIRHGSISYMVDECEDIPPLVPITKPIVLPAENYAYQKKLIEELKDAGNAFVLLDNVFHRMRQLPSGYLVVKDPEGEKVTIRFKDNPKLEMLIETINEIRPDRKIIVFADYKETGHIICKRLEKERIRHVRMYSGTTNKGKVLEQFTTDPKIRVLVGSRTVMYGHNLQAANYIICYETPTDPKDLKQLSSRHRRMGQTRKCFMIYLVMKKTIDEKIMKAHKEGRNLYQEIVVGPSKKTTSIKRATLRAGS